ncbi:MAG: ferredoxin [Chloroflexi bacterium]|nr:ferredoxin [Chloroflexota bacterium]MYI82099.1 ferredoxin [Chloroflexota bacterium]
MRVKIDLDQCSRVGDCFIYHRKLFRERRDGAPEVLVDPLPEDLRESAEYAVKGCPTGAISIEDE